MESVDAVSGFPLVICHGCKTPMQPKVTEAADHGILITTYRCERCEAETLRMYKLKQK